MLIAQGCFSYGWAVLTLSGPFLLLIPSSRKDLGEDTAGTDDPNWPKVSHPQWFHAQLGRSSKGALSEWWFVSPSPPQGWWSLAFLGIAEHLPGYEKWGMNSIFCFSLCAIISPTKLPLSQPTCFLPVTFLILSSVPLGSCEQQVCESELLAGVEPWHHEKDPFLKHREYFHL